jgi:branched-chain amino acid transport system ATP-binding protein
LPAKGFHECAGHHGAAGRQNVELALDIADRAYVLDQGAVVYQAAASALLADNEIKQRYCSV